MIRNKAHLLAQGYSQVEEVDFDETFDPVSHIESIRVLLALACHLKFKFYQMDVKTAFLNGFLKEDVYDYGSAGRMDTNDSLRVASLWHSMHAISQQLSPVAGCSGIELLEADTFDLHCFQSLTGTKFFVVCEPGTQHMEALLKVIYELYTDYVLKNPFYEIEMPIRCELFDINLSLTVQKERVALLGR
nr:trafficking protein particle complex subunit 4-like [Quercus suber]